MAGAVAEGLAGSCNRCGCGTCCYKGGGLQWMRLRNLLLHRRWLQWMRLRLKDLLLHSNHGSWEQGLFCASGLFGFSAKEGSQFGQIVSSALNGPSSSWRTLPHITWISLLQPGQLFLNWWVGTLHLIPITQCPTGKSAMSLEKMATADDRR